jgi:hypothetical protein
MVQEGGKRGTLELQECEVSSFLPPWTSIYRFLNFMYFSSMLEIRGPRGLILALGLAPWGYK